MNPKLKKYTPIDDPQSPYPWLWIGTWSMGGEGFGPNKESNSIQTLELAYDHGIRHFDTAHFYAHGRSEHLLANVFKTKRRTLFISSKGGLEWNGNQVHHNGSKKGLRAHLESSLKSLKTSYIDLFQLHWPDPNIPISESISTLKSFQKEGLIRFWGVGNLSETQLEATLEKNTYIPHQVHYNPLHTQTHPILEKGHQTNRAINCIVSPFEQGLLTSQPPYQIGKHDIRNRNPYFSNPEVKTWTKDFREQCNAHNVIPELVTLSWLLTNPLVDVIIPGPRTPQQLHTLCPILTPEFQPETYIPAPISALFNIFV